MSINPREIPTGAVRYNTDSNKMEVYIGSTWMEVAVSSPTLDGGGRGLVMGGNTPDQTNTIQFITISKQGNSQDFGDLTARIQSNPGATGSSTRGLLGGGQQWPALSNKIDFVTFSSTGNASDFGDLTVARRNTIGNGNQTRGVFAGGQTDPTLRDEIDFVTIASTGNAVDFGNLTVARKQLGGTASSPTRGLFMGGLASSLSDVIDFITIPTTGNAQDFGDLLNGLIETKGASSSTRAVMMAERSPAPSYTHKNTIQFVTIATLGNAQDFGDLTSSEAYGNSASASDCVRAVRMGGGNGNANTIDYILIATQGDAVDFGDLITGQGEGAGCSNAHGGL